MTEAGTTKGWYDPMTYFIDQERFYALFDQKRSSPKIDDINHSFGSLILRFAEHDCLNYWNGRQKAFTYNGKSVASEGMPETRTETLQAIGKRFCRDYDYVLEEYVNAWECVQGDFTEIAN